MRMASVSKDRAEDVRQELARRNAIETDFHIIENGASVLIPIRDVISNEELLSLGLDIVEGEPWTKEARSDAIR